MGKKNKPYQIYGDLIYKHRPTIRTMIIDILYEKFIANKKQKASVYRDQQVFPPFEKQQPLQSGKFIAIISSDNTVVEILKLNEKAADILLDSSNYLILFNPEVDMVKRGTIYKDNVFVNEDENEEN
jgi:hypothetical protein